MKLLKSIDELYSEVRDYDLVITNDAALETALNARVDTVRIGPFAITPRHLAGLLSHGILNRTEVNDLELVAKVSEETELDFKYVYSEIVNFRNIRRYTADVRAHLTTNRSRRVYESYSHMPTREKAMADFDPTVNTPDILRDKKVAVIGPDLFDDLDKHFNPSDHDVIEIFKGRKEGTFDIDVFHQVGNDRQLAEHAVDLIDPENAGDFAIVLNASSPITDAVRAALYRREISFVNSLTVRDLTPIRDYIGFLSLSMDFETVRVGQVKELFTGFHEYFRPGRERYLLSKIDEEEDMRSGEHRLRDIMRRTFSGEMTFEEVMDSICDSTGKSRVGTVLKSLGMLDDRVTPDRLAQLRYAVDNVTELKHNEEIPESERTGVLLADCHNSVYVDRPVVIFVGMEQDWNVPITGKRYIDYEDESEKNAKRFSALIQQGEKRIYIVNTTKNGKNARPCLFFDQILDRKCERFSDIAPVECGRWVEEHEPPDMTRGEFIVDGAEPLNKKFSKTSFDAYYTCPRKYLFNSLLPTEEKKSNEFGTLIHSFAELYSCHRDLVQKMGVDSFVDMISDRYTGLSSPTMEEVDSDAVRRAMVNLMRYIDLRGVRAELDFPNTRKSHPNRFMELLDIPMSSTSCETDYPSSEHEIHGEFDLLWDGVITDYKTGNALECKEIGKRMTPDSGVTYYEFQPLIYLAIAIEKIPGFIGRFELFYAMDNDVDSLDPGFDIRRNIRTVVVEPGDTIDVIRRSPALLETFREDLKQSMKPHAEAIIAAVADTAVGDASSWRQDPAVVNAVVERAGLTGKNASEDAGVAIGKLTDLIMNGMVVTDAAIEIPRNVLDRFLEMVDLFHKQAMEKSLTDFEAAPRKNCDKCDFREVCTMDVVRIEEDDSNE